MKYIRTKDGIYKLIEIRKNEYRMLNADGTVHLAHYEPGDYKIADTIEELIQDGDILYIRDLYPDAVLIVEGNIKPFGYNDKITLKEWLKFKHTEFELYLKQSNGNYHKVASKKPYEKLVLI